MARKHIPTETETRILLKSRRRCCLCLWLDGIDEVQKGQIAHLDQNNQNAQEDNLVFLCLEHHDEYDGRTSTSKGLKAAEIKSWRDELYREMEHAFGSRSTIDALGLKLEEGNNFFHKLENVAELEQLKIDVDLWDKETEALIEKELTQADVSLFRTAPPPSIEWSARFNGEHNRILSALRGKLDALTGLITRRS